MADQNITALPKKTSSQLAATDYLLGIDSAEGYQMLIQDLGDYIIQHAISSLAGSNQTLANAISALNSNFESNKRYFVTSDARFLKISLNNVTDGQEFILMNTRGDLLQLFVQSGSVSYTKYNVAHSGIYEISISGKDVYIAIKFGSEYGVQGWAIYGADKFVYTLTRVASVPSGATSAAVNTSQIDALNNSLASTRYTATLNSEYFESGTVYVYLYGSVCTIVGSDLKVKKAITATNVVVATSDKIPAATGSTPFFLVHDYTNHSVYRARVGAGQVDIPYDAGAAVNDQLYFTVTYIVGSTAA